MPLLVELAAAQNVFLPGRTNTEKSECRGLPDLKPSLAGWQELASEVRQDVSGCRSWSCVDGLVSLLQLEFVMSPELFIVVERHSTNTLQGLTRDTRTINDRAWVFSIFSRPPIGTARCSTLSRWPYHSSLCSLTHFLTLHIQSSLGSQPSWMWGNNGPRNL